MTDHTPSLIVPLFHKAKGGTSKTPREESIEDALISMAEGHAQLVLHASQFKQFSNAELNKSIETMLEFLLPNMATDIICAWENLYRDRFWQAVHFAKK